MSDSESSISESDCEVLIALDLESDVEHTKIVPLKTRLLVLVRVVP